MNMKIAVVSVDGVLVEGALRKVSPKDIVAQAALRIVGCVSNAAHGAVARFSAIEEVRLLKEGTTAGRPLRGATRRDRLRGAVAVGAMGALMVFIATLVY